MANKVDATTWNLGLVRLSVTRADLFDIPAEAVVNSEQSDFVLSSDPGTISGQILHRFGHTLQEELDSLAGGQTLPAGSVLQTSGGDRYRVIFHAGFHAPDQWLDDQSHESDETESVSKIRHCVRSVLGRLEASGLASVAFPMIGTGHFGLSVNLLAYEFAREVAAHARNARAQQAIWLSIRDQDFASVVEPIVQGILDELQRSIQPVDWELGVGFLDRFNQRRLAGTQGEYRSWMLIRYAELVLQYFLFVLAVHSSPKVRVQDVVQIGRSLTFGYARKEAQVLAIRFHEHRRDSVWATFIADRLIADKNFGHWVSRIVDDRNSIAHGRNSRSFDRIKSDLQRLIDVDRWSTMRRHHGDPGDRGLSPWVRKLPGKDSIGMGVLV